MPLLLGIRHRMRFSPHPVRRLTLGLALLALVVTLSALVVPALMPDPGEARAAHPAASARRQLVLAIDGLSWDAYEAARKHGLFARFRFSGRHVAPYPSMSHPSWTEIFGTRRVFGVRGNIRTVEARWFDLDAMRIADDPRQIIARQALPYNYMRAFDYYLDPFAEPLMFFRGRKMFDRELDEAQRAILDNFTGDRYVAYLGGTDATAHTHIGELASYLERLDAMIERVADSLDARGTPAEMWLVSDHGNAGGFVEGEKERYLTPVSLDAAVKRAGLTTSDTGRLERPDQVAIVTIALATMVNVYFADLERRRAFARSALAERSVELVTWLEVSGRDRYVVILGSKGSEAHLRWREGSYAYERVQGNPLELPDSLMSSNGVLNWISDAAMRAATVSGHYPDAPFRLVQSASKVVENAPDLIVNLRDGYCHGGDLGRYTRMVRTHGSLSARSSSGILASTARPVPSHVRGEEVLGLMSIAPAAMFERVAHLQPHDPLELARTLAAGTRIVSTGRDDESLDAGFLRRARPILLSMDYFGMDALRELLAAARPDSASARARSSRVARTRRATERSDVFAGVSENVDTLLSLTDSLDGARLPDRVREAEALVRTIPALAPLAGLRSIWSGDAAPGGGVPLRRITMAMWTLPYFVDAALNAPEHDSIPDPRDFEFAVKWHRSLRASVANNPTQVLDDSSIARRLFAQVYAERRLWRAVEPATIPLLYEPDLGDVAVVYIPGLYGELFDQEFWSRGLRAVHDRLGVRTVTLPVDGRCSSSFNAERIVAGLRDDTRRRQARGYATPRYLLLGYSKGGVDATEALVLAPELARTQVAALVTIASPLRGTPVAERSEVPAELVGWGVRKPRPALCDSAGWAPSVWPATRAAFWSAHGEALAPLTRYFSISFVTDMEHAHPWMKITKLIGQFVEPNDGVVALSASLFPEEVPAVDLGVLDADHLAGRLASSFPQEAFLEALVISVAELGGLEPSATPAWNAGIASGARRNPRAVASRGRVAAFRASLRPASRPPGGAIGWTPDRTFRMSHVDELVNVSVREMSPVSDRAGITLRCDQRDMAAFRTEYEFSYDAGNGGSESDADNGFAIVPANDAAGGRACHLATRRTSIKMTSVAFRFRPVDFPSLQLRMRVDRGLTGVDVSTARRGRNDSAFKLWLVMRDTRDTAGDQVVLFGYSWGTADASGYVSPPGALLEATSSRRNVLLSVLPEAWLVTIGGPRALGSWQTIDRDLGADVRRAYPGIPSDALQVVGITLQTDSDDSQGTTEVFLESMRIAPERGHVAFVSGRDREPPPGNRSPEP